MGWGMTIKIIRRIQYFFFKINTRILYRHKWIVDHCFIDLYANSTPKADFRKLVENATINKRGEKEIPFMNYSIPSEKYNDILNFYKSFLKNDYYKNALSFEINLGCSPKSV